MFAQTYGDFWGRGRWRETTAFLTQSRIDAALGKTPPLRPSTAAASRTSLAEASVGAEMKEEAKEVLAQRALAKEVGKVRHSASIMTVGLLCRTLSGNDCPPPHHH